LLASTAMPAAEVSPDTSTTGSPWSTPSGGVARRPGLLSSGSFAFEVTAIGAGGLPDIQMNIAWDSRVDGYVVPSIHDGLREFVASVDYRYVAGP
jgi:hypothetical protein